jgi:hypothetical protein
MFFEGFGIGPKQRLERQVCIGRYVTNHARQAVVVPVKCQHATQQVFPGLPAGTKKLGSNAFGQHHRARFIQGRVGVAQKHEMGKDLQVIGS